MNITLSLKRSTRVDPSPRVLAVAGMFGLGIDEEHQLTLIEPTALHLQPGTAIYITGPSGGGKSSLLRLIAEGVAAAPDKARVIALDALPALQQRPIVDGLADSVDPPMSLERVLELLSLAGLGDAFVMLRRPDELSDGQRYRLQLARLMAAVDAPGSELRVVLADEFGATLDRITAKVIARNIRKWLGRCGQPVCFIAATTHDDLLDALEPDVVIEKGLGSAMQVTRRGHDERPVEMREGIAGLPGLPSGVVLREGSHRDYAALAEHHYRAGRPATMTRVLALEHSLPTVAGRHLHRDAKKQVAAVLVESLPSLCCRLRDEATRNRYGAFKDLRQRGRVLNREVRCISRVIVHPQFRGLGLAVRLVRQALATATTPVTEAIAAMGNVNPFFERAGMTAYRAAQRESDARLIAALAAVNINESQLATIDELATRIEAMEAGDQALIRRELRRWYGRTMARSEDDLRKQIAAARKWLHCEAVYYLHVNRELAAAGE